MHIRSVRSLFLLLCGFCFVLLQAFTIPATSRDSLALQDGPHDSASDVFELNARSPAKAKSKSKATKSRPKTAPKPKPKASKPKSKSKKPAPKKSGPKRPTTKKPISKTTEASVKPTPTATKSRIWKVPRPTTAFNTCNLPKVECFSDYSNFEGETSGKDLFKRAKTKKDKHRGGEVTVGTDVVKTKALDYPGASTLYISPNKKTRRVLSGPKAIFGFASPNIEKFSVKMTDTITLKTVYTDLVTEHIVEIQSIGKFIEAVVQKPKAKPLSQKVDISFFVTWWNKPFDKEKIIARPNKMHDSKNNRFTLNNLVYEALGSKTNRQDIVLCNQEINSYKGKLWTLQNPMSTEIFESIATDAAKGDLPSTIHLSAIRTTLAVFEYMNHAEVKTRMQNAIKNVETELKNIEDLTGVKVLDDNKKSADLAALWMEFMKRHLEDLEKWGQTWIKTAVGIAQPLHEAEMDELKGIEKKLLAEEKGTPAHKKKIEAGRTAKIDKLEAELKTLKVAEKDADDDLKAKVKKFKELQKMLDKESDADKVTLKKKEKFDEQLDGIKIAEATHMTALKTKNRKQREIYITDPAPLKPYIDSVKKDQDNLAAFKIAGTKIKMPTVV